MKRSNAFLEDSYDAKAAYYDGVKHFNVLPPVRIDTVDTPKDGQPSGSNENTSPATEAMPEGIPEEKPGVVSKQEKSKEPESKDVDAEAKKKERQAEMKRISSNKWHEKWISKGVPRVPKDPNDDSRNETNDRPANMRDACAQFVAKWISECGLPPSNERRKKAYEAWMSSDERSKLLAGKSNVQG